MTRTSACLTVRRAHDRRPEALTESSLNGFASSLIPDRIEEDPYRFLICADQFQTGYDEPLLPTMYVDKVLSGIRAVQTLSRLNRAHPLKRDTFVLDFMNDAETIQTAFAPYYRTTILAEETDPNKLHDLKAALDGAEVYTQAQIDELVGLYLGGADRDRLDPILDACVAVYDAQLGEDQQVAFKGNGAYGRALSARLGWWRGRASIGGLCGPIYTRLHRRKRLGESLTFKR
jgi:type I restriction enzyme R subunit